ncbi:MAG: putative toxin-antitoxin system toxin component, PIN family [Thiobacillus sp.]|nr:putative toxin-antitoxin system toxin component, PIN family [Thiobacillus sp.]
MRAVIDTNVLISGLLWRGAPHRLLEHARSGELVLITSPVLLAELAEVMGRAKFAAILERANTTQACILDALQRLAEVIKPPGLDTPVCRDPDDDEVLALSVAAQADLIVSGDDDLLALKEYLGVRIVNPAEALSLMSPA